MKRLKINRSIKRKNNQSYNSCQPALPFRGTKLTSVRTSTLKLSFDTCTQPHLIVMAYEDQRSAMVEEQLLSRGISDERVLKAMDTVPRNMFVSEELAQSAYKDCPLPIGNDQTISQPYIVAFMAEAARIQSTDKVLEVGTGCGYSAAVLSLLAETVYTAEIIPSLGNSAKTRLEELGYNNIIVMVEDGSTGFSEHAPYDVIVVAAGAPSVPKDLLYQLRMGGRMVVPVLAGSDFFSLLLMEEKLLRLTRIAEADAKESFKVDVLTDVSFVPLKGKAGWQEL